MPIRLGLPNPSNHHRSSCYSSKLTIVYCKYIYIYMIHYTDFVWALWRLKSCQLDSLFNSFLILTMKVTTKRHITIHLWGESPRSPHKGPVMWKVFRSGCTHAIPQKMHTVMMTSSNGNIFCVTSLFYYRQTMIFSLFVVNSLPMRSCDVNGIRDHFV